LKHWIACLFSAVLFGCLPGCASVEMRTVRLKSVPRKDMALVTFVRQAIFLGDGTDVDLWDGPRYVGSLAAGRMVQLDVAPGQHLFLANAENWSYASGELEAGKQYVLKVNVFPGVVMNRAFFGIAKPDDKRIPEWLAQMKPTAASAQGRLEVAERKQAAVRQAIADFDAGKATFTKIPPDSGFQRLPVPVPTSGLASAGADPSR